MAEQANTKRRPDLGDLVVVLLGATLRGLSCRLDQDGFPRAADLVMSLAMRCDEYVLRSVPSDSTVSGRSSSGSCDLDGKGEDR